MRYSLILPSRERPQLLDNLLDSVQKTAHHLDLIEAWVALDWDDRPTLDLLPAFKKKYPFATFLVTDRQDNLSQGYYNRLASFGNADLVQVLNDDCLFVTPGWDDIGHQAMMSGEYLYGRTQDDEGTGYSCFPLLLRKAYSALGWFFHPEMSGWGADMHLARLFGHLPERCVEVPYKIAHISHHTGKRERDGINWRIQSISHYNYASADGEAMRLRDILATLPSSPNASIGA